MATQPSPALSTLPKDISLDQILIFLLCILLCVYVLYLFFFFHSNKVGSGRAVVMAEVFHFVDVRFFLLRQNKFPQAGAGLGISRQGCSLSSLSLLV